MRPNGIPPQGGLSLLVGRDRHDDVVVGDALVPIEGEFLLAVQAKRRISNNFAYSRY